MQQHHRLGFLKVQMNQVPNSLSQAFISTALWGRSVATNNFDCPNEIEVAHDSADAGSVSQCVTVILHL